MKLYQLNEQYREDVAKLQNLDLDPETILDTIDSMQGEVSDKIKAVLIVSLEMQALGDARIAAGKAMIESGNTVMNRAEGLRSYAQISIQNCGLVLPLKYTEFTVNLQRNPLSCEISDEEQLSSIYKSSNVSLTIATKLTAEEILSFKTMIEKHFGKTASETVQVSVKVDKKTVLASLKEVADANAKKAPDAPKDRIPGAHLNPVGYRVTIK